MWILILVLITLAIGVALYFDRVSILLLQGQIS